MSNMAPHSRFKFDSNRHFLRQDVIFADPGAHILLKWTKTLQDRSAHHFVQIPSLANHIICPVRALQQLLQSRPLPPSSPLFVHLFPPFNPVIDTTIRDGLRKILDHLGIPLSGHGFHTFRRSGATLAFDNNVQLQHYVPWIMEKLGCLDLSPECICSSLSHSLHLCLHYSISPLVGLGLLKIP